MSEQDDNDNDFLFIGAPKRNLSKKDYDTLQKGLVMYREQDTKGRPFRTECGIDREFYDGEQWTADEKAVFQEDRRIPMVTNEVAKVIDLIRGMESRNRLEIRILPRHQRDVMAAQVRTALIKYVADQNELEFRIAEAFFDTLTYGYGVLESGISDRPGKEPLFVRAIPPDKWFVDPCSLDFDLDDAEYCGVHRMVTLEDLQIAFPKFANQLNSEVEEYISEREMKERTLRRRAGDQYGDFYSWETLDPVNPGRLQKRIKVVQLYYKKREESVIAIDQFGDSRIVEKEDMPRYMQMPGMRFVKKTVPRIHVMIFTAGTLLHDGPSPYKHQQFPYVVIWAGRDKDGNPVGPIRNLRDLQREVNRRSSAALAELLSNQWTVKGAAAIDLEKLRQQLSDPNGLVDVPPGIEIDQIMRLNRVNEHMTMYQEKVQSIRDLAGTSEPQGAGAAYQSGTAKSLQQQQGTTQIAKLFDNLRRTRKQLGFQLLSLIHQSMTPGKVQRIIELQNIAYDPTAETERDLLFDVVVEEQQLMATDRQSQLFALNQILQTLPPDLRMQLLPEQLAMYDLPMVDDIIAKLKQMQSDQQQGPPQAPPTKPPAEMINYKDAPEDIKRQMEKQAGFQPSQIGPALGAATPDQTPQQGPTMTPQQMARMNPQALQALTQGQTPTPQMQQTQPGEAPAASDAHTHGSSRYPDELRAQLPPQLRNLPEEQLQAMFGQKPK